MIDPSHVPPIAADELLARFIVNSNEVRADGTVRPQLFLPYKRVELSVNRHRDATLDETWAIGRHIAEQRGKTLLGRADIHASACRITPLDVVPRPILPMPCVSESSPDFDRSNERPLAEVRKGYTHFADGDVLFAKITPCMENGKGAVATGLKNGLGCGTTELHVIRPRGGIDPHYVYRFLQQESVSPAVVA